MGYIKAIIYGDNLELYTYEKNIKYNGRGGTKPKMGTSVPLLVDDRGVAVRQLIQKRRDNASRSANTFRRLVLANLSVSSPPALITCTYAKNQTNIRIAYQDFRSFIGTLRYRFGKKFRYITVPEFQKRGAIHFHSLFWGLPENISTDERHTRLVASMWGHGFVDCYLTDGNEKISSYIAKYMAKSYLDDRLGFSKAYRCSRNILRPIIEKNLGGLFYLSEMYNLGVDNFPCKDKQFDTQWLGKGRYRHYNNIKKI
ncbi:MAG TPA: hypothetical protein VMR41_06310 [Patescibacteria group bacterium]|nr:hypothetical protein [Patescibacteria group bacterium]